MKLKAEETRKGHRIILTPQTNLLTGNKLVWETKNPPVKSFYRINSDLVKLTGTEFNQKFNFSSFTSPF